MTYAGLFEGYGANALAATWMGWDLKWSNDIDPWSCALLRTRFKHRIIEGDINQKKHEFTTVDVLAGGPPCQPASIAGKRQGTEDSRWLWTPTIEVVRESQPGCVVFENPDGLRTLDDGEPLEGILTELENLGYWNCIRGEKKEIIPVSISAASVGAWHQRDRIFIIAHTDSFRNKTGLDLGADSKATTRGQTIVKGERKSLGQWIWSESVPMGTISTHPERDGSGASRRDYAGMGWQPELDPRNRGAFWQAEPRLGRLVHGSSNWLDRHRAQGNGITPQVSYEIFKSIELSITDQQYGNFRIQTR